tara:strand:+ start:8329 stop:8661 length:333 start_codon:yes stop_codon:yes gene_type:complete
MKNGVVALDFYCLSPLRCWLIMVIRAHPDKREYGAVIFTHAVAAPATVSDHNFQWPPGFSGKAKIVIASQETCPDQHSCIGRGVPVERRDNGGRIRPVISMLSAVMASSP